MRLGTLLPILALVTMILFGGAVTTTDAAGTELDPGDSGGGGTTGDSWITNGRFDSSTTGWSLMSGSTGSVSVSTSTKYEGTGALKIAGTIAIGGYALATVYQSISSMPITSNTKMGAAIYLDSDASWRFAAVALHITPGDYYLVYYISDTWDMPDIADVQYTYDMGDSQDQWYHFYRSIYYDISDNDEDPAGQYVDEISCHVRTESWWWQSCNAYFDQLYLGNTPPSLTVSSPIENAWVHGTATFSGTAADNRGEGFNAVYYLLDPTELQLMFYWLVWTRGPTSSPWSFTIDTTTLTEGSHIIYIWSVDVTGSRVVIARNFRVDNTLPTLSVSSPTSNSWVRGTISVTGTAADSLSGLLSVRCRIGTADWVSATGTDSWSCSIDTTKVSDGAQTLTVEAYDVAGNCRQVTRSVGVDNTAPALGTVTMTPAYGPQGTTFSVTATITETGSGVSTAVATITDPSGTDFTVSLIQSGTNLPWVGAFTLDASDTQGTYTLKSISVTDVAGNAVTGTYTTVKSVYDRTVPTLTVSSHSDDDIVSGTSVEFAGTVDDLYAGVASLTVSIDGATPISVPMSGTSWSLSWLTDAYQDGYHVFRFVATDRAGNYMIVDRNVILRNNAGYVTPFVPVIDQYRNYLGSARVTIGDSQLVIVFNVPDCPAGTDIQLLIAPPYDSLWGLEDIAYVSGTDTISFISDMSVVWDSTSHRLVFSSGLQSGTSLCERSVLVSVGKMDLVWTLLDPVDYSIVLGESHTVIVELRDSDGNVPVGLPFDFRLEALQDDQIVLLASSTMGSSGTATVQFVIGLDYGLRAGPLTLRFVSIDSDYPIYDVCTAPSSQFEGFSIYERPSWSFSPDGAVIVHYSPTVYDQRQLMIQVTMTDSFGEEESMIGQSIGVTLTGTSTSEYFTILQTVYSDGIYAFFAYNLTSPGDYSLIFDYLPSGYYIDISDTVISVDIEGQRPVDVAVGIDSEVIVGTPIVLEALVTDGWAEGYPVEGIAVTFNYWVLDMAYTIGMATSDGLGVARFSWTPTEDEWLALAGQEVNFEASTASTSTYLDCIATLEQSMPLIPTYFVLPLATPLQISAGENVTITVHLYTVFGHPTSMDVHVEVSSTNSYSLTLDVLTEIDSTFDLCLSRWGNYSVNASFSGSSIYAPCSLAQTFEVIGMQTFTVISTSPLPSEMIADTDIIIQFQVTDIYGARLDSLTVEVEIDWMYGQDTFKVITGLNDTVTLHTETSGTISLKARFVGEETYEPSFIESELVVARRPTDVSSGTLPDTIYPNVAPSLITYILQATVTDQMSGSPIFNATVMFCYVTEQDSVVMPFWNLTGYINETLASDYLAWGLFHSIGTAQTDVNGIAIFEWVVPVMPEQELRFFALTFRDSVHETGISEVQTTQFQRIGTAIVVEARWRGDEKNVNISASLFDQLGYRLYGEYLEILIQSIAGGSSITETVVVLTGVNDTFVWTAPEYGTYRIAASYNGSEYFAGSESAVGLFVVSWRLIDILLDGPTFAYDGDDLVYTVTVVDLNATSGQGLLESVTVSLLRRLGDTTEVLGSVTVGSDGLGVVSLNAEAYYEAYCLFAFAARTTVYEAALSNIVYLRVDPIATKLTVNVDTHYNLPYDLTYKFDITLVDQFGNSVEGAIVHLLLTDNYTDFWCAKSHDHSHSLYCDESSCFKDSLYHSYLFTVVIGYNDTFTFTLRCRHHSIEQFNQRAIVMAEYDGDDTYLPSADTKKVSCHLIQTSLEIELSQDWNRMNIGTPQLIRIIVVDEYGKVVCQGFVNVTITGSNGMVYQFRLNLKTNNTVLWTPTYAGRYTVEADYEGGVVPARHRCHFRCEPHCSQHEWRMRFLYSMRLIRCSNVSSMLVSHAPADIVFEEVSRDIHCGETLVLGAHVFNSITGAWISDFSVSFMYIDELGRLWVIGSNSTDANGYAHFVWSVPVSIDSIGYRAVLLIAEGSTRVHQGTSIYSKTPVRLWPVIEESAPLPDADASYEPMNTYTKSSPVDAFFMMCIMTTSIMSIANVMRLRPGMRKLMAVILMMASTVGILYVGLALESFAHPFKANLIFGLDTNVQAAQVADDTEYDSTVTDSIAARGLDLTGFGGTGTAPMSVTASTSGEDTLEVGSVATSPNASYVVVPLKNDLDVSFYATGRYVVSILDELRHPVDTASGVADGLTNVSFMIGEGKYGPGKVYTVNTFVTSQSYGIIYGDTSWIRMVVSKVTCALELRLESDTIQYCTESQTFTTGARLTEMRTNMSISDSPISFYYRSALDLTWYDIGTAVTSEAGVATLEWDLALPKGSYVINATYAGDEIHDSAVILGMLEVEGAATVMSPVPGHPVLYWTQYAHPVAFYSRLTDYYGNPLEGRTVDFYLRRGGAAHWIGRAVTGTDGIVELTYSPYLSEGQHGVEMVFAGDANYAPSQLYLENALTVLKQTCQIADLGSGRAIVSGHEILLDARFEDDRGNPLGLRAVAFEIYDPSMHSWVLIEETTTDVSGYAKTLYTANLVPGKYAYRVTLLEDDTTHATAVQGVLTVLAEATSLYLVPVSTTYGHTVTISAHLQDGSGLPIAGETLLYYIECDDVWLPVGWAQTSEDGWADLDWISDLPEGVYNVKVIFPGTQEMSASEYESTGVTVRSSGSVLSLSVPAQASISLPVQLNLTLTDEIGLPLPAREVELRVYHDSQEVQSVTLQTDIDGRASYVYIPPYLGEFEIRAVFRGDGLYGSASSTGSMTAEKIELAISLVLSQVVVHRGDVVVFSGYATRYDPQLDRMVPVESGVSFDMYWSENTGCGIPDYSIVTMDPDGCIVGSWAIPSDSAMNPWIQAANRTFDVVVGPDFIYSGSTSFEVRVMERTEMAITPERNSVAVDEFYVEQATDFRFILFDEDGQPMTGYLIHYSINGVDFAETTTADPINGVCILHEDYCPATSGGLYVGAGYDGSIFFDSTDTRITESVIRRDLVVQSMDLNSYFTRRYESLSLTLTLADALTGDSLIDSVGLYVLVDGLEVGSFASFVGDDTVTFTLPGNLQAGGHTVQMHTALGRVYNVIVDSTSFTAFEYTELKFYYPDDVKSFEEQDLRVCLYDEDGTPLPNRFVELAIETPEGGLSLMYLETDNFGEAHHAWSPQDTGSFVIESAFDGERLYEVLDRDDRHTTEIDVQEGGGKSESGISPLWVLPVILLLAVDVALEFFSFGCLAFLMVSTQVGDAQFSITKIAYPSIKIVKVDIWFPIIGWQKVPIPIPYIYTDFSIKVDSPGFDFEMSSSSESESTTTFNGKPLMGFADGLSQLLETADIQPKTASAWTASLAPPETKSYLSYVGSVAETEQYPFQINITSPEEHETIDSQSAFDVEWVLSHPSADVAVNSEISVDGGTRVSVAPDSSTTDERGSVCYYHYTLKTVTDNLLDANALRNGAHKVEIEAEVDGESESSTRHFYVWSPGAFICALFIFFAGIAAGAFTQWLVGKIWVRTSETVPAWAAGAISAILSGIFTGINVVLVLFFIELAIGIGGGALLTNTFLGLPIGVWIGIGLIVLGILFVVAGFFKAPNAKMETFAWVFAITSVISVIAWVISEALFDGFSILGQAIATLITEALKAFLSAVMTVILLTLVYKCLKGQHGYISKEMQYGMFYSSIGVGLILGAISLILRTIKEQSREQY